MILPFSHLLKLSDRNELLLFGDRELKMEKGSDPAQTCKIIIFLHLF